MNKNSDMKDFARVLFFLKEYTDSKHALSHNFPILSSNFIHLRQKTAAKIQLYFWVGTYRVYTLTRPEKHLSGGHFIVS